MKLINTLSSVKLFFTFSALLLAAFIIGGLIPQGASPQAYQEMFGRVGGMWVTNLRFNGVFSSCWFLALMGGGALNILACTIKQWKLRKLHPGVFLSHLGVMLMLMGGGVHGLFAVRGTLALEIGQAKGEFIGDTGTPVAMPFEIRLKNFKIYYWDREKHIIHALQGDQLLESVEVEPGGNAHFKSAAAGLSVLKFYPDFPVGDSGPFTGGGARGNPALAVMMKNGKTDYLLANHPGFNAIQDAGGIWYVYEYRPPGRIKQFESRIAVVEAGSEKMEKTISVNAPADYKGYRFYQSGYDAMNLNFSRIQVSRDPSVAFVYAGFAVLMTGLTWALWPAFRQRP